MPEREEGDDGEHGDKPWHDAVREQLERCTACILVMAETRSIEWELGQARKLCRGPELILVVGGHRGDDERLIPIYCDVVRLPDPPTVPMRRDIVYVVTFDAGWSPSISAVRLRRLGQLLVELLAPLAHGSGRDACRA